MKKHLLFSTFPSFETATGEAGGAAVATPAAATAPAAAPSASGGGSDFGFFRNVEQRETKAAPAAAAESHGAVDSNAPTAEKPFAVSDDAGKPVATFATQAEAEAYIETNKGSAKTGEAAEKTVEEIATEEIAALAGDGKTETATGAEVAPDAVLKTPIFGRFKTIKETEEYIKQSGAHAQKLDAENKAIKADLATRDAEIAAAKAELEVARNTPPFQELSKEDYDKLAKEDPGAAVDYRLAKRDHDAAVQKAKDDAARGVRQRQEKNAAVKAEIERTIKEMEADPVKFPMFKEVDPIMGAIHESLGGIDSPMNGDPRALTLYYKAALGTIYASLIKKGKIAKGEATAEAKKTAAAAATTTAGTGAGGGAAPAKAKTKHEIDAENWRKGIHDAAPKSVLNLT